MSNAAKSFTSSKFDWCDGVAVDPRLEQAGIFKVAYCISQHVNAETGIAILSDEVIREKTNVSIPQIKRHRAALRDAGWLSWETRRSANHYSLKFDRLNVATDLLLLRKEARKERQAERKRVKTVEQGSSPATPHHHGQVSPATLQGSSPVSEQGSSPATHIHLNPYTFTNTHSEVGLTKKEELEAEKNSGPGIVEEPFPAVDHPQIAETMLIQELGEGDSERGVFVASRIGDARFKYLHRELMGGTLLPSAVRAASACLHDEEAA